MALSQDEIARRIQDGEAKRNARLEKRNSMLLPTEKKNILQSTLVAADDYHRGLSNRLKEAERYLEDVQRRGKSLEITEIPKIVDLFEFSDDLDARVAYKMCHDELKQLIIRCWYFHYGTGAALGQAAYVFWNKMLSFPEVVVSGTVILNILNAGLVFSQTVEVLKSHREKFKASDLGFFIGKTAERLLRDGGFIDERTMGIKEWTPIQREMLVEIANLFKKSDYRSLEEMAEDSAE